MASVTPVPDHIVVSDALEGCSESTMVLLVYADQITASYLLQNPWVPRVSYPDHYSEGRLAALECLARFDSDKGQSFQAFIRKPVWGALLRLNTSYQDELDGDDLEDDSFEDDVSWVATAADKAVTESLLTKLDDRTAKIISMSFGLDGGRCLSDSEIAPKVGLSRTRVGQLRRAGVSIMKED